ncbi:MAG: hypothetical protein KGH78_01590 [Candidatus Micrarchaeota archaeon]|nr:hypothetical protein [Candidatus Micrarchaeota archaeon]
MEEALIGINALLCEIESIVRERVIPRYAISDWRTYRQKRSSQIKKTIRILMPTIRDASISVRPSLGRGRKPSLDLEQKLIILLVQQLMGMSNRGMSYMLTLFSSISGIHLGYKSIERLRNDVQVYLALLRMRDMLLG